MATEQQIEAAINNMNETLAQLAARLEEMSAADQIRLLLLQERKAYEEAPDAD